MIDFHTLKNWVFATIRHTTKEMSESCCVGGLVITKNFKQRKEKLDQKLLSKKQVKIENAQSRYSNRTFSLF